jgi:hypothetical protein
VPMPPGRLASVLGRGSEACQAAHGRDAPSPDRAYGAGPIRLEPIRGAQSYPADTEAESHTRLNATYCLNARADLHVTWTD